MKSILISIALFTIGQSMIWFQTNGQFIWKWCKDHTLLMSLLGFPIAYIFITATKYVVEGYDGELWPGRLIGFGCGIVTFGFFTWFYMSEGLTMKTVISVLIAIILVLIQVFWK